MYADDLVVWCVEEHLKIANKKIQKAADNIAAWAEKRMVKINAEKSSTTLFILSNEDKAREIKLGNVRIQTEEEPVYFSTR